MLRTLLLRPRLAVLAALLLAGCPGDDDDSAADDDDATADDDDATADDDDATADDDDATADDDDATADDDDATGSGPCDDCTWAAVGIPVGNVEDIHGSGTDNVWAVASSAMDATNGTIVARWDGSSWSNIDQEPYNVAMVGVHAFAADDVWAVATGANNGGIYHYGAGGWEDYVINAYTNGVWGAASDDVWVVGAPTWTAPVLPVVTHWDGAAWTQAVEADLPAFTSPILSSVWGSASDDVYVGGQDGLWHYDGAGWAAVDLSALTLPGDLDVDDIHGSSADDVWAVSGTTVLHYDGSGWSVFDNTTALEFEAVFAAGPDDVWFGGGAGSRLARWDGAAMEEVILSTNGFADLDSTEAIWGGAANDVWAGGTGTNAPTGDGRANGHHFTE